MIRHQHKPKNLYRAYHKKKKELIKRVVSIKWSNIHQGYGYSEPIKVNNYDGKEVELIPHASFIDKNGDDVFKYDLVEGHYDDTVVIVDNILNFHYAIKESMIDLDKLKVVGNKFEDEDIEYRYLF